MPTAFRSLSSRAEALALLSDDLERREAGRGETAPKIDACACLARVARAIHGLERRESVALEVDCDPAVGAVSVNACAQIGLLVSEFVTYALKHAF